MKQNNATPSKDAAIAGSNKFATYSAKLADLPIDNSLPSLKEGGVVLLDGSLWKVDVLLSAPRENLGYNTIDTLIVTKPDGKDAQTLLYWTDYDREISIPLDSSGLSLSFDAWLRPSTVSVGNTETFWPQFTPKLPVISDPDLVSPKHSWGAKLKGQTNVTRMEHTNGEWKFWSAWIEGNYVGYHYGNINSSGTTGRYANSFTGKSGQARAEEFLNQKINEKLKKGYRLIEKGIK